MSFYFVRDLVLLSTNGACGNVQYNRNGNRLLFMEREGPQVIDLSAFINSGGNKGKKNLTITDHPPNWPITLPCCFAGTNDELVVATSNHHQDGLYIWSVPACAARFHSIEADQKTTRLHTNGANISAMFFSKNRCALVACGLNKPIQVWTPFKLPQIPTENMLQ